MSWKYIASIGISAMIVVPLVRVNAQSDAVKSARQEVIESIDLLEQVKTQDLTAVEKQRKEFDIKKATLEKIIHLSALETEDMKSKLDGLKDIEPELSLIKDGFSEKLDAYLNFFSETGTRLAKIDNTADLLKLAGSLKDWRETEYNPIIKKVIDFVIVFQNKTLLKIADQRFLRIAQELKRIKAQKPMQTLLNQAALNLKEARTLNNQASDLLIKREFAVSTTDAAEAPAQTNDDLAPKDQRLQPPAIKDLVEASLNELKTAYKAFMELSDAAKKSAK